MAPKTGPLDLFYAISSIPAQWAISIARNPITDLSSPDNSPIAVYKPVTEPLERARSEKSIQWGPKVSSNTKAQKVALKAGVSAAVAAALPVDLGAYYRFTSEKEGGAILLTKAPVKHEKYFYESPFKDWIRENAGQLLEKGKEILEYGLWIVTSTWSTEECAINVWNKAGNGVGVGFKSSVVGLGELAPSGGWYEDGRDEGWVKIKAEKDDDGRVVFFGGLRFVYRRISFGKRLKSDKKTKNFRSGYGSARSSETVTEVPVPAGMASKDGEMFAVDYELVLDTDPGKSSGAEEDGDDDDW